MRFSRVQSSIFVVQLPSTSAMAAEVADSGSQDTMFGDEETGLRCIIITLLSLVHICRKNDGFSLFHMC